MKKTLTALVAAATVAGALAVSVTDASAQRRYYHRHGGGGFGPGLALGLFTGALVTGAILATRPRGYVVYEGYGQPVHHAGCYWAAEPVYNQRGRVVGYTGEPVQVCPY